MSQHKQHSIGPNEAQFCCRFDSPFATENHLIFSIWNYPVYANTMRSYWLFFLYSKHIANISIIQITSEIANWHIHLAFAVFLFFFQHIRRFGLICGFILRFLCISINWRKYHTHNCWFVEWFNVREDHKFCTFLDFSLLTIHCILHCVCVFVCVFFIFRSLFRKQVKPKLSYGYNNKAIESLWSRQNATGGKVAHVRNACKNNYFHIFHK